MAEFVALWSLAEQRNRELSTDAGVDWYTAGVVVTCRWLACATVRPAEGRWYPAESPVTQRPGMAFEELIEAEARAAEVLAMRDPRPRWLVARPGWVEGIVATFAWAWRRAAAPPLVLTEPGATA